MIFSFLNYIHQETLQQATESRQSIISQTILNVRQYYKIKDVADFLKSRIVPPTINQFKRLSPNQDIAQRRDHYFQIDLRGWKEDDMRLGTSSK